MSAEKPQLPTPIDADREAKLATDRVLAKTPLPYSHLRHYENEGQRQVDLAAAERGNIAEAAGALGLTSGEWLALREKLGRSPQPGDV